MNATAFSSAAIELFKVIVDDAADWSGNPGPNLDFSKQEKGYLTKLKTAGLLDTAREDGILWVFFKQPAVDLARDLGLRFDAEWVSNK